MVTVHTVSVPIPSGAQCHVQLFTKKGLKAKTFIIRLRIEGTWALLECLGSYGCSCHGSEAALLRPQG